MNEQKETNPLQVGDVVVIPAHGGIKALNAVVRVADENRNWCKMFGPNGQKVCLTLTRANELARVSK